MTGRYKEEVDAGRWVDDWQAQPVPAARTPTDSRD
jgi:hypothetical protein